MTALLPAESVGEVRAFAGAGKAPAPAAHPLEAMCIALRQELEEARVAIADGQRDRERAVETAWGEGRQAGLAQAEEREAERLVALGKALEGAVGAVDERLAGLDRLAAELAAAALTRLFDDPAALRAMSASFIARQVQGLKDARLVRAQVSAQDFVDTENLAALGARLRDAGVEVEIIPDAALKSGQARLDLTLGRAELDLSEQWQSLAALLRSMARE